MTAKKKRPKARYVAGPFWNDGRNLWAVCLENREPTISRICDCHTKGSARRIAAALNFHEAHKRGEL